MLLKLLDHILGDIDKTTAQQWFHDNTRDMTLLELSIEVVGVGIVRIYLLGMFPVEVVELYLYEVPFILVVLGEEIVEDLYVTVIGEAEVAYTT